MMNYLNNSSRRIGAAFVVSLLLAMAGCRSWPAPYPPLKRLEVLPFDIREFETKLVASDADRVRSGILLEAPLYVTPDTGYMAAWGRNFGAVFRTVDGGAVWRTVGEWADDCFHVAHIEGTLYAVVRKEDSSEIYRRSAGCAEWRKIVEFPGRIERIHPFDRQRVAVFAGEEVKVSVDGGDNWTDLSLPGRIRKPDKAFFSGRTAYFVCREEDGAILFCSWNVDTDRLTMTPIPYPDYMAGDGNLVMIIGSGRPKIYEIRNGWLQYKSSIAWGRRLGGGHFITEFLARSDNHVFSLTNRWTDSRSVLAYSSDGGSTWSLATEDSPFANGATLGRFDNDTLFRLDKVGFRGEGVYRTARLVMKK